MRVFDVVVAFVLGRPTKLRSNGNGAMALFDKLVPFLSNEYICVLYPALNGLAMACP